MTNNYTDHIVSKNALYSYAEAEAFLQKTNQPNIIDMVLERLKDVRTRHLQLALDKKGIVVDREQFDMIMNSARVRGNGDVLYWAGEVLVMIEMSNNDQFADITQSAPEYILKFRY